MGAAQLLQFVKHPEQIQRFGRGVDRGQNLARQVILNRSDKRGRFPGSTQDGINQRSAGGLAVRSSHGRDANTLIRLAKEIAGRGRERLPAMRDLQPGSREAAWRRSVADDRNRAFSQSCVCKLRTVGFRPGKSKE